MKKTDWRFYEVNGRSYRIYDYELKTFEQLKEMLRELNSYTHQNWCMEWFIDDYGMFYVKICDENYKEIHVGFDIHSLDTAMYSVSDFIWGGLNVAKAMANIAD